MPVGTKPRGYSRVETSTTYSWSGQYLPFQFTNQGNLFDVETIYSSSQAMKTYVTNPANSGYTKKVCFYISAPSGSATGNYASLTGYLEDAD